MLSLLTQRRPAVFLLLAGFSITSCSKSSDRAPSSDTTAATSSGATTAESASAPLASAAKQPSDTPPPNPKPSIDPGRKRTKAATVPRAAATPATDTAKAASTAPASSGHDQVLKYDAASHTVTFQLMAGPFNFNGFTNGAATLLLPPKANVVINFVNKDGTPHSAEVISGDGPIPNAATDPAIPRAYTNKVLEGLPQEGTDAMRFTVPESGKYRIFCGVPGHGLSGMWIWMTIDPAAKAPSFGPTK